MANTVIAGFDNTAPQLIDKRYLLPLPIDPEPNVT